MYTSASLAQSACGNCAVATDRPDSLTSVSAAAVGLASATDVSGGPHTFISAKSTPSVVGETPAASSRSYVTTEGCFMTRSPLRMPYLQVVGVSAHARVSYTSKLVNVPMHAADVTTPSDSTATPEHHSVWLLPALTPRKKVVPVVAAYVGVCVGGEAGSAAAGNTTAGAPQAVVKLVMNAPKLDKSRCILIASSTHSPSGDDTVVSSFIATSAPFWKTPPPLSPWQIDAAPCARHTHCWVGSRCCVMDRHAKSDSGTASNWCKLCSEPESEPVKP